MQNKRLTIIFGACVTVAIALFALCPPACAAEPQQETMAASLKELGLFKGTDRGFELDKPCDRLMGAVILTRLLGREQEALEGLFSHTFADIANSYAEPYIGYLYQAGLVSGVNANTYGQDAMTAQQFAALILRVLGYEDGLDFSWNTALYSLADLGVLTITEAQHLEENEFLRGQAVLMCYRALIAVPKNMTHPLVYKLLWDDVFSTRQLARSKDARLLIAADMPDLMGFTVAVYSEQEFKDIYWLSLRNRQYSISIYAPEISTARSEILISELLTPYFAREIYVDSYVRDSNGNYSIVSFISEYISMQLYYENPARYQKNFQFYDAEYHQPRDGYISMYLWLEKLNAIVKKYTTAKMSEYEKVKALHDFLVQQTTYDKEADDRSSSHFADGVLFGGKGVCDGFSSALKMLLDTAGIETVVIYGETPEGKHAWNQVKIDGEWYNVDATWARTLGNGDIYYGYFCVPDRVFTDNHKTENAALTHSCTSEKYYLGAGI